MDNLLIAMIAFFFGLVIGDIFQLFTWIFNRKRWEENNEGKKGDERK